MITGAKPGIHKAVLCREIIDRITSKCHWFISVKTQLQVTKLESTFAIHMKDTHLIALIYKESLQMIFKRQHPYEEIVSAMRFSASVRLLNPLHTSRSGVHTLLRLDCPPRIAGFAARNSGPGIGPVNNHHIRKHIRKQPSYQLK